MSTDSHLFCTMEQGERFANIVDNVKSYYVWREIKDENSHPLLIKREPHKTRVRRTMPNDPYPALMLQELRDLAIDNGVKEYGILVPNIILMNAHEFAEWLLKELEGAK